MVESTGYIYLAPRDGSAYRQYFVKGRNLPQRRSSAQRLGRSQ